MAITYANSTQSRDMILQAMCMHFVQRLIIRVQLWSQHHIYIHRLCMIQLSITSLKPNLFEQVGHLSARRLAISDAPKRTTCHFVNAITSMNLMSPMNGDVKLHGWL